MTVDFRLWSRQVRGLTLVAVGASIIATAVVGLALAVAHSALTGGDLASLPTWQPDLPSGTVAVLVLAVILLTLASVIQSLLRKVDAMLVRRRLSELMNQAEPVAPRLAMSERFLMEGWTHWVSAVVQALGFSLILAWLGGVAPALGVVAACLLAAVVGRRHFRRAEAASSAFLDVQQSVNAAAALRRRANRRPDSDADTSPTDIDPLALADAVYRRDNEAFRLPALAMTVLSVGIVVATLVPALVTLSSELPLYLIVLLIWRQRMIDAVTTVGTFAWTLCVWRRARTAQEAIDDVDA